MSTRLARRSQSKCGGERNHVLGGLCRRHGKPLFRLHLRRQYLKLGGTQVLKVGTKSKPIRLVEGDDEISCKMDGIAIGLKACFVKKA